MKLLIRSFAPVDQIAVKALILAGLVERWGFLDVTKNPDLDDIAHSYADAVFLTAWLDDVLVGTGVLVHEAVGVARIVRMSVARAQRRCGIGQALLQRLCVHAQADGCQQVVLETTSTWADAVAFYTCYGFRALGTWDGNTHFALDL